MKIYLETDERGSIAVIESTTSDDGPSLVKIYPRRAKLSKAARSAMPELMDILEPELAADKVLVVTILDKKDLPGGK